MLFLFSFFFRMCVIFASFNWQQTAACYKYFLAQHFRGFIRPELVALWQLCLEISVIYDAFLGGMPLFTISDFIMEEDERNCFCSE